jgi:tripartite-type tricarboxylate transporter receptor subunit TctC
MRRAISAAFSEIGKDPDFRTKMQAQGLEIVDVPYDKMSAFLDERKKGYLEAAKLLGLAK